MLILRDAEVLALRERPEASRAAHIAAVEGAFAEMARGTGRMAERLSLVTDTDPQAPRPRSFKLYAAVLQQLGVIGSLTYPAGYGRPLDLRIQVCSAETGRLLALVEGESITHWSTGAVTAAATRRLAREDARVMGLIGTGTYALEQAVFIAQVRALREIRCFSRDAVRRQGFVDRLAALLPGVAVRAVDSAAAAVQGVDILTTVTTAQQPVFDGRLIQPGTHVNAIGMHYPKVREIDTETVSRSRVFVDDLAVSLAEKGELLIPLAEGAITRSHLLGDLGALVTGGVAGRLTRDEVTLFASSGLPVEMLAVATLLVRLAQRH